MNALLSRISNWLPPRWVVCVFPVLILFVGQPVWGQSTSPNLADTGRANWVYGPARTSLGTVADIEIPAGFRIIGEQGARSILARTGNPLPKGLVGILAPSSGDWWAVIEYTDIGYMKNISGVSLDPEIILAAIRSKKEREIAAASPKGKTPAFTLDWKQTPVYDSDDKSLVWALLAETDSAKWLNFTAMVFGRNGVLGITAVQSVQTAAAVPPLKAFVKNIVLREGQRYEDYRNGDKLSTISLVGLMAGDEQITADTELTATSGLSSGKRRLIVYSAAGCLVVFGGVFVYRKVRRWKMRNAFYNRGGQTLIAAAVHTNGNGNGNGHANGWSNGSTNGSSAMKAGTGKNGNRNGAVRRKMAFDYAKFYTDFVVRTNFVMSTGSMPKPEPNAEERPAINGDNGRSNMAALPHAAPPTGQMSLSLADLIACQKAIIEEQKRLIQQQTGLIDEKNNFIKGQSEFLARQTAAYDNQFSLKLD